MLVLQAVGTSEVVEGKKLTWVWVTKEKGLHGRMVAMGEGEGLVRV